MTRTREARREAQQRKRAEAEARNAKSNATRRPCGHVHGDAQVYRCEANR
jgi:hypothetical protein